MGEGGVKDNRHSWCLHTGRQAGRPVAYSVGLQATCICQVYRAPGTSRYARDSMPMLVHFCGPVARGGPGPTPGVPVAQEALPS